MNHQFKQNKADEYYTKEYAIMPLLKYLQKNKTVWCPFDKADSNFVKVLANNGNYVTYSHIETGHDFFEYEPEHYDYIVSNPPYSLREPILERLFLLGKPFAMLINEAGLFDSKKRYELLKNNRFEIMIFDRRIDYIKGTEVMKGVPFKSIYLCSNLLPTQFVFENLNGFAKTIEGGQINLWSNLQKPSLSEPTQCNLQNVSNNEAMEPRDGASFCPDCGCSMSLDYAGDYACDNDECDYEKRVK
mgnify:CR=1 FL=1